MTYTEMIEEGIRQRATSLDKNMVIENVHLGYRPNPQVVWVEVRHGSILSLLQLCHVLDDRPDRCQVESVEDGVMTIRFDDFPVDEYTAPYEQEMLVAMEDDEPSEHVLLSELP